MLYHIIISNYIISCYFHLLQIQTLHADSRCQRYTETQTTVTSPRRHGPDINRLGLIEDVLVVQSICTPEVAAVAALLAVVVTPAASLQ